MRPWIIDADDVDVSSGLSDDLIERTPAIQEFLSRDSPRFIVTGTKGYGKTLLLKAKRLTLQDDMLCVPANSLLDKPIGDKIFGRSMIDLLSGSTQHWRRIWRVSICAAVLKRTGGFDGLEGIRGPLGTLLASPHLVSVIDHFVNVLDFKPNEIIEAANETDRSLIPRLRNIGRPIAVFIDSVDEYFDKHISHTGLRASASGEIAPDVWYLSQMSLVETAYELRRVTHHLKVFITIRKEAYARLAESNQMVQQYSGSIVDLTYSKADLRAIFDDNVRAEARSALVEPGRLPQHPVAAFLGSHELRNSFTGEMEDAFDYIYRHTFQRPRDLMSMGAALATVPKDERRKPEVVKRVVNTAATGIAEEYLAELRPYWGDIEPALFWPLLSGPILLPEQAAAVADRYSALRDGQHQPERRTGEQMLTLLYKMGFLGYIVKDVATADPVQRFAAPGERTFEADATLPASGHYLIHPALSEIIIATNREYARNIDRVNVLGAGRPWRRPATTVEQQYVLRADIKGFSRFMADPDANARVWGGLEEAVETHAKGALFHAVVDGDAVTIVHDDVERLIACAQRIMEDLHRIEGHPSLRVAIVRGPVHLEETPKGRMVRGGEALRLAARIEPHVEPNEIWGDQLVKDTLDETNAFYMGEPAVPVGGDDPRAAPIDVRKSESDGEPLTVALYRIVKRR